MVGGRDSTRRQQAHRQRSEVGVAHTWRQAWLEPVGLPLQAPPRAQGHASGTSQAPPPPGAAPRPGLRLQSLESPSPSRVPPPAPRPGFRFRVVAGSQGFESAAPQREVVLVARRCLWCVPSRGSRAWAAVPRGQVPRLLRGRAGGGRGWRRVGATTVPRSLRRSRLATARGNPVPRRRPSERQLPAESAPPSPTRRRPPAESAAPGAAPRGRCRRLRCTPGARGPPRWAGRRLCRITPPSSRTWW